MSSENVMSPTTEKYRYEVLDYEYKTLMSAMHVSVSRHLLDEHFTVLWANDCYYRTIGYPKEEYEALFHNRVTEYFKNDPDLLFELQKKVESALANGQDRYEAVFTAAGYTRGRFMASCMRTTEEAIYIEKQFH